MNKRIQRIWILGFALIALLINTSCADNSSPRHPRYVANSPGTAGHYPSTNANYRYGNHDYHKYKRFGTQFPYHWNNYASTYLSRRGPLTPAYCSLPVRNYATGICYSNCLSRQWTSYVGTQPGLVWDCGYNGSGLRYCGWKKRRTHRTWWMYTWVPVSVARACL